MPNDNGKEKPQEKVPRGGYHGISRDDEDATQMTCDVLCSLGASAGANGGPTHSASSSLADCAMADMSCTMGGKSASLSACPKQHQLPMFLSKTYHMIDRCEPSIATWSMDGSNFVVKNVEKFASNVLPLYFKHSNFSSFARQLNFYGFRKLRTDPILTSDVDPRTACFVRFYHEKFQKDRPELLHQIKRATKSDQQSKDDVESLKGEMCRLKDAIIQLRDDTDRRIADMSYEYNRRITSMGAEYDKLAAIVQQLIATNAAAAAAAAPQAHLPHLTPSAVAPPSLAGLPAGVQNALQHNPHAAAIAAAAAVAAGVQPMPPPAAPAAPQPASTAVPQALPLAPTPSNHASTPTAATVAPPPTPVAGVAAPRMPDLMQSLSQAAAISLQQQAAAAAAAAAVTGTADEASMSTTSATTTGGEGAASNKRPAEGEASGAPPSSVTKV